MYCNLGEGRQSVATLLADRSRAAKLLRMDSLLRNVDIQNSEAAAAALRNDQYVAL